MILHSKAILGSGTTCANEMNFVVYHATSAGSIARPVGQQSSTLPLYHGCLHDGDGGECDVDKNDYVDGFC